MNLEAKQWEADAVRNLAQSIRDYLDGHPPPTGAASMAVQMADWAKHLDAHAGRIIGEIERADVWRKDRERQAVWGRVSREERERLVVELLGDDRLTIRELTERFQRALPEASIYESNVGYLLRRLAGTGVLNREAEPFRPTRSSIRYRYSVRPGLAGPIADLERALEAS